MMTHVAKNMQSYGDMMTHMADSSQNSIRSPMEHGDSQERLVTIMKKPFGLGFALNQETGDVVVISKGPQGQRQGLRLGMRLMEVRPMPMESGFHADCMLNKGGRCRRLGAEC